MPDEFKIPTELSDFMGVKGDSLDDFKSAFEKKFIKIDAIDDNKEIVNRIYGDRIGSVETKAKSLLKKAGVEFSEEDLKDKKVEDIMELGFGKLSTTHEDALKALKDSAGKTDSEAMTELQGKYETLVTSSKKDFDELNGLHGDLKTAHDKLKTDSATEKTTWQKNSQLGDIDKSIDWATETEFFKERKQSFMGDFAGKYNTKLSDEGNILITDKEGNRIKNEDKAGEHMTYTDMLKKEAVEAKLIKTNAHSQGKPPVTPKANEPKDQKPVVERVMNTSFR